MTLEEQMRQNVAPTAKKHGLRLEHATAKMNAALDDYTSACSTIAREHAIGFAEWMNGSWRRSFITDDDRLWANDAYSDVYTTVELYELYLKANK